MLVFLLGNDSNKSQDLKMMVSIRCFLCTHVLSSEMSVCIGMVSLLWSVLLWAGCTSIQEDSFTLKVGWILPSERLCCIQEINYPAFQMFIQICNRNS